MKGYYDAYLERFRNLDYLEKELGTYKRLQAQEATERDRKLRRLQQKLKKEKVQELRGESATSRRQRGTS